MAKLCLLIAALGLTSTAIGAVSTRVCRADGCTPLELADPNVPFIYRDIMVGTKLTIIVNSDTGGFWGQDGGGLYVPTSDTTYGILSGRDCNGYDWEGSRFEEAGSGAGVYAWEDQNVTGFELHGHISAKPGDWFIIDYTALEIGECRVEFWDYNISWDQPISCHWFRHVPTRDFDNSAGVDLVDLAVFASWWLEAGCIDPDWCDASDLNADGIVDSHDFALFAEYWLETTQ